MSLKNWDNKTWLSSKSYIKAFNQFLISEKKLNNYSKILDIGCGRGNIIGNLSNKLRLINKPIGIDLLNLKDKNKKFCFKKIDANLFLKKNKMKFDIILIKQTIHFFKLKQIPSIIKLCKKSLKINGKIFILLMQSDDNIPSFILMKKELKKSFQKDKKIKKIIYKISKKIKKKKFGFKVLVSKKKYIRMIKQRYISVLLNLTHDQINKGIDQIKLNYPKKIRFYDKLDCIILKN